MSPLIEEQSYQVLWKLDKGLKSRQAVTTATHNPMTYSCTILKEIK